MASWWRLRTQAYLVLSVLLFLIAFLGAYALSEAKRHAAEADELLGPNYKATGILKEIETARAEEMRTAAKFRVTSDPAYRSMFERQSERVDEAMRQLQSTAGADAFISPAVAGLREARRIERAAAPARYDVAFAQRVREVERRLETQRSERVEHVRMVARDLGKIIFVAFLIAIGVTSWLGFMLYRAVLMPLESIKVAARRIREGELSYRVERFRGFAELTALRREFNAMAAKLEELDRMKSDFLSTVSHELKTPLTALKEGLLLLSEKQETLPPAVSARTIEVCTQAAKRLETMIQNLLTHAKMESGFYDFDERPKNFIGVLESAVQGVKPIAERRRMNIEMRVEPSQYLAAFSTEGITHALENMLLNAIKYGDAAHPIVVEVRRIEASPVPWLETRVSNHGRGLLPTELTQVFERFFRASNADGQKGVGLGLSVVKRIIEAHHGAVAAQSQGGVTTFWFRIPQRYESRPAHAERPGSDTRTGALMATLALLMGVGLWNGCATPQRTKADRDRRASKLAHTAIEMLDPAQGRFDAAKGKAYLEYSLRNSEIRSLDVPAPVLLELLRSEKTAMEKSRTLEQRLEIMKGIDLNREEEL